jgi:hypothetical protein
MINKKQKMNILELRFNEEGASLHDLKSMSLYEKLVDIKYYYLSSFNIKTNIAPFESEKIKYNNFFDSIKKITKLFNDIDKNEIIYITSTSYLMLYIVLLFTKRKENIYLLIHFIPLKNKWLHKFCIKQIIKIVRKVTVPNDFVYQSVISEIPELKQKDKLNVLYTHTLKNKNNLPKVKNSVLILFGNSLVNSQKQIVEKLDLSQFKNLQFKILAKVPLNIKQCNNVKIINEYISDEKYNKILNESEIILLNYGKEYSSRYSKMIYDSMEYNIKIVTNYLGSSHLSKWYDYFFQYDSDNDLVDLFHAIDGKNSNNIPNNSLIIMNNSDERRYEMFKKIFGGYE